MDARRYRHISWLNASNNYLVEFGTPSLIDKKISWQRIETLDLGADFRFFRNQLGLSFDWYQRDTKDMADDEVEKTLILRVINHKRYKDYFIKVRKNIPVYGADFTKSTVYNYSGDHIYADFTSLLTRSASFDGNYVLIVSRAANKPHLLKVSDLIAGTPNPIPLDLTGVSGGTYSYNQGALANGHIYIATLSGSKASPLKIYYWDTPNAIPETIANINVANIPNSGNRYGDNMA